MGARTFLSAIHSSQNRRKAVPATGPVAVFIAMLLLLSTSTFAASVPKLSLAKSSVFVGEPATLVVTYKGTTTDQPDLIPPEGASVRFVDKQNKTDEEAGASTHWRFLVIARRPGSHVFQVPVGGDDEEEMMYPSIKLEAKAPQPTDQMKMEVRLSTTECYVGQPIILEVDWSLALPVQNVRAVEMRIPVLENNGFRVLTPHEETAGGSQTIGLPVSETRVIAKRKSIRIEKVQWTRISFRRIIIPQASGNYQLEPATLLCSVYKGAASRFQYPSYFNNDFFLSDEDTTNHVRTYVASNKLKLNVKDLPAGTPDDYSGIVGKLSLQIQSQVTEVEAGEPIAVTITATDYPVPEALDLPRLQDVTAYANRFDCPSDYVSGTIEKGGKRFERIIRPQRPDVREIPAISLTVLDPSTNSYTTIKSNALPITVQPARKFTAFDADFSDGRNLKNQLTPSETGIGHNVSGPALLASASPVSRPSTLPLIWLILLLPPGLFAFAVLRESDWYADWRDPRRKEARNALRAVLGATNDNLEDLTTKVRNYLTIRLDLLHHAHNVNDVAARSGLSLEQLAPLADLYAAEGHLRYGDGKPATAKVQVDALIAVIREVDKHAPAIGSATAKAAATAALIVCCLLIPTTGKSASASSADLLQQAEQTFEKALATAMDDTAEARRLYRESALLYEQLILENGIQNASVFMNTGNAWYFADDHGRALVNYLRAEQYDPKNTLLQRNLRVVRGEVADEFRIGPWRSLMLGVHRLAANLPEWLRILIFAGAYGGLWWLLWRRRNGDKRFPRTTRTTVAIAILALAACLSVTANRESAAKGVVTETEIMPRKGNSFVYDGAFSTPMHAGTEFVVLETRGDWLHIEIANGEQAWLPKTAAQLVTRD